MKRKGCTLLMIAAASLLSACTTPAVRRAAERSTMFDNETVPLSTFATIYMTSSIPVEAHPEEWGICLEVLRKLTSTLESRKRHYSLTVLDTPMPNAFSLPNGKIYVTTGLLTMVSSDDALAGVLGHEIGHVELEHYARKYAPKSGEGGFGPFTAHLFEQEQEHEADSYGVSLAKKAGYSPSGLQDFLMRIRELENRNDIRMGGFLSTHPDTASRLSRVSVDRADRQPSESFKRMKAALHRRNIDYSPLAVLPEEPPRLASGNRDFDRSLSEAIALLRGETDLREAARRFETLQPKAPGPQAAGAIHAWRSRAALYLGDYAGAERELTLARESWPELKTLPALRINLLNASGEREAAARLWRELGEAPGCVTDDDCARQVAQLALSVRVPMDEREQALKRYMERLRAKVALTENDRIGYSRALSDDIAIELNERYPERQDRDLPPNLSLTAEAKDWLDLEREYFEADQRIGFRERGYVLTLGSDFQGAAGGLHNYQPSALGLVLDVGIGHWPVEYGFRMLLHFDPVRGKTGPYYRESSYGGYLRYQFSSSRWRPFIQGAAFYSRLDEDTANGGAASTGVAGELGGGLSLRLNSQPGWADFFFTLSAGARGYTHPSWGASGFVQAGLTVRLDSLLGMRVAESEDDRASNPRLRPPPQLQ